MQLDRLRSIAIPALCALLLCAGLPGVSPKTSSAAADARLSLISSATTVQPGGAFSVSVELQLPTDTHAVSALAFQVVFDASLFQVVEIKPSSAFPAVIETVNQAGKVGLSLSVGADDELAIRRSATAATIDLVAKQQVSSTARMRFDRARALSISASDSAAMDVIGGTDGLNICIAADASACEPLDPTLSLDKSKSKYNGWVTATVTDFAPNSTVNVRWPGGTLLVAIATDGNGIGSGRFRTPLYPLDNYTVRATDSSGHEATATLRIIPRIMLAPESEGPTGFRFRVYFYGYAPGDRVQVWWYEGTSYDVLKTITVADNGRASTIVYVPDDASTGDHLIRGKVIGVSRSTTATFRVTGPGVASEPTTTPTGIPTETATLEPTQTTPDPSVTAEPSIEPTATSTLEPTPTETSTAEPTEPPIPTDTPVPEATDVPTASVPEEESG